jgi:hypothetical protein
MRSIHSGPRAHAIGVEGRSSHHPATRGALDAKERN